MPLVAVPPAAREDEFAEWVPEKYQHESIRGARLPGWEDLNCTVLAADVGIGTQHARQVLTGRSRAAIWVYQRVARCLCITVDELLKKVDRSRELDQTRKKERDR